MKRLKRAGGERGVIRAQYNPSVRYHLMIRSRPDAGGDVPGRHRRFLAAVSRMSGAWAPKSAAGTWPAAKDPGSAPLFSLSLRKVFGLQATARYANRRSLADSGTDDDYFVMEFDPARVDYAGRGGGSLQELVEAFDGYVAQVGDKEFIHTYHEAWRKHGGDYRESVFQLYPLNYFDGELCRRAFGMTPRQVVAAVKPAAELAEVWRGGALVFVTTEALPFAEADALCRFADKRLPRGKRAPKPKTSRSKRPTMPEKPGRLPSRGSPRSW